MFRVSGVVSPRFCVLIELLDCVDSNGALERNASPALRFLNLEQLLWD